MSDQAKSESNPKQILLDLEKELSGDFLESEVEVRGKVFLFRTLNDKELSWTFSKSGVELPVSGVEAAMKLRRPTIAVGIKAIGGTLVEDLFADEWKSLTDTEKSLLLKRDKQARRFHAAGLLLDYLDNLPSLFIQELFNAWTSLEDRQQEAQKEVKNSSGEGSQEQ